mgnify:CR=1 FL=1
MAVAITLVEGRARRSWTVDDPPPQVRRLVQWFCYDRVEGESIKSWAEATGIAMPRINKWMRDARVKELLDHELRASHAHPQRIAGIMDMLYRRATVDSDVKAAQLYLQAVDRLVPKRQLDIVLHDARSLSDQELHAELRRAVALLEQRGVAELEEAEVIEDSG